MYQIAKREALNLLKKRSAIKETTLDEHMSPASGNGKLDKSSEQLLTFVMELPKQQQHVILLRYFEGHSVKAIATMLGRPIGTVAKQLSRAHIQLRRQYKELVP